MDKDSLSKEEVIVISKKEYLELKQMFTELKTILKELKAIINS